MLEKKLLTFYESRWWWTRAAKWEALFFFSLKENQSEPDNQVCLGFFSHVDNNRFLRPFHFLSTILFLPTRFPREEEEEDDRWQPWKTALVRSEWIALSGLVKFVRFSEREESLAWWKRREKGRGRRREHLIHVNLNRLVAFFPMEKAEKSILLMTTWKERQLFAGTLLFWSRMRGENFSSSHLSLCQIPASWNNNG